MDKKKNVLWLRLVSFFTDTSSEMIFPIIPIFLTSILNANMAIVGLIEGVAESTSAILKLFSGWFSDKIGKKKPIVFGGYAFSTFAKPFLAIATSWWHVLAVRFADRVGKGIRDSPRDALIAASSSKKERGRLFGLHRMLDTAGAMLGTIIASILLLAMTGKSSTFRWIFFLSVIPGIIALWILSSKVKEVKAKQADNAKKFSLRIRDFNPVYRRFLLVLAVFNFAQFSYAFFILRARDVGVILALIPIIYLVYNVVYAGFAVTAGKMSDKIGRKNVLSAGYLLFGLVALGFALAANSISVWFLFALYGLFMAITDGVSRAYVSDLVKAENRGFALGAYHSIVGITVLPANLIGGFLWNAYSAQAPFIYASVLSIVSALLLFALVEKKK